MNVTKNKIPNRLVNAYNQMMSTIRETFDNTDTSDTTLQKALNEAKEQAVHLGEITLDEAHEISEFIKRDINDAAEYMMETSAEFSDWLMLDIEVLERKVVDMFLSVADRTRIELEQFKDRNRELSVYYAGEITGPGTLVCSKCGRQVQFPTTAQIEPCPKCDNNTFRRAELKKQR